MTLPKQALLTIALMISSLACFGRKYLVDSIDGVSRERVRIAIEKVGDAEYRKFAPLCIEQKGSRYYISFTLLQYINTNPETVTLPQGSVISFQCGPRKAVTTITQENNDVLWYCHWYSYPLPPDDGFHFEGERIRSQGSPRLVSSHKSFNDSPGYLTSVYDRYALNWTVRTELSRENIQLLGRKKITEIYVMRNGIKLSLPITSKQAGKIQRCINSLLHDK